MPPLNVATFGKKGVNVVDSPLHLSDDDLAAAQNAEIFFEDGYPAIRKRLGMVAGVSSAMDGAVFSLTSIPLPDPAPAVVSSGLILFVEPNDLDGGPSVYELEDGEWTTGTHQEGLEILLRLTIGRLPMWHRVTEPAADFVIYPLRAADVLYGYRYNPDLPEDTEHFTDIATSSLVSCLSWHWPREYSFLWVLTLNTNTGLQELIRCAPSPAVVAPWSDSYGTGGDNPNEYAWDIGNLGNNIYVVTVETIGGWNKTRFRKVSNATEAATTVEHEIAASNENHLSQWELLTGTSYLLAGSQGADSLAEARLLRCDGDGTWTEIYRADPGFVACIPVLAEDDEFMFWEYDASAQTMILQRSVDAGASWTALFTRTGIAARIYLTEMIALDGSVFWAECVSLNDPVVVNQYTVPGASYSAILTVPGSFAHGVPMLGLWPETGGD